jgi:protein-S-isoprenylcysteine O-methyltransferase Ste14
MTLTPTDCQLIDMNALELKIPPMGLALLFALAMWGTTMLLPSLAIALPWHRVLATVFSVTGVLFILAAGSLFRAVMTTVNPTKPDSTSSLVVSGVYRLSRNPMYVGALLVLAGWAVFLSHPLPVLFLPAFVAYMNRFQITPEERALSGKFGADYERYKKTVRRWL